MTAARQFKVWKQATDIMQQHTRDRFPITVKKGHATVKVYEVKNRKTTNYTVTYISPTGRQRRTFADLDLAKREAGIIAQNLADGDMEALKLTGQEKQIYVEAERAIAGTGLPLHSVAHEFARAFDILGGANIVEAARYFKKHVDPDLPPVMVADAVEKFREAKEAEGMSAMYLKDIRGLLGHFASQFQCPLSSIQPDDLRQYLNAKRVGLVSKENRRRMLVVLFNFAKANGWLRANEETAADALGTYKITQREVEIYTPAEIRRLLNAADTDFLPYVALICFGGVRREELHKGLSWDAINFERNTITVPASIAKTGRKRKIVMAENLSQWLAPYRVKSSPIFNKDPRKRIAKLVKASGVTWKRNALRHSFGSYRMEQTKNEGQVALEMGNSPKIVKDHYFEIVDEKAAEQYWNITPAPVTNVVPMQRTAVRRTAQ
jgi:integrase